MTWLNIFSIEPARCRTKTPILKELKTWASCASENIFSRKFLFRKVMNQFCRQERKMLRFHQQTGEKSEQKVVGVAWGEKEKCKERLETSGLYFQLRANRQCPPACEILNTFLSWYFKSRLLHFRGRRRKKLGASSRSYYQIRVHDDGWWCVTWEKLMPLLWGLSWKKPSGIPCKRRHCCCFAFRSLLKISFLYQSCLQFLCILPSTAQPEINSSTQTGTLAHTMLTFLEIECAN